MSVITQDWSRGPGDELLEFEPVLLEVEDLSAVPAVRQPRAVPEVAPATVPAPPTLYDAVNARDIRAFGFGAIVGVALCAISRWFARTG